MLAKAGSLGKYSSGSKFEKYSSKAAPRGTIELSSERSLRLIASRFLAPFVLAAVWLVGCGSEDATGGASPGDGGGAGQGGSTGASGDGSSGGGPGTGGAN